MRDKLRKNKFMHKKFNPKYTNSDGMRYYDGIYEKNKTFYESPTKDFRKQ